MEVCKVLALDRFIDKGQVASEFVTLQDLLPPEAQLTRRFTPANVPGQYVDPKALSVHARPIDFLTVVMDNNREPVDGIPEDTTSTHQPENLEPINGAPNGRALVELGTGVQLDQEGSDGEELFDDFFDYEGGAS